MLQPAHRHVDECRGDVGAAFRSRRWSCQRTFVCRWRTRRAAGEEVGGDVQRGDEQLAPGQRHVVLQTQRGRRRTRRASVRLRR